MELVLLAAPYLAGLAALAVPILLHLRPRTRPLVIRFSATRFLRPVLQRTARRLRFQNLLLLALRLAVVALAVLAFAMPLLRRLAASALPLEGPCALVLVLDVSMSMGVRGPDGSRLDRAKTAALRLLDALGPEGQAALVLAGPETQVVAPGLTRQRALVREKVTGAPLTAGRADLRPALLAVGRLLKSSTQPTNHVVVFTDLQRLTFLGLMGQPLEADLLQGASLTVVDVAGEPVANAAVVKLDVVTSHRTVGLPLELAAEARLFGPQAMETLATLVFDDRPVAQRALALAPAGRAAARFTHTFHQAQAHGGYVELAPDALEADNRHYIALQLQRPAPVLCVDGDLSAVASRQETFFFRTALDPLGEGPRSEESGPSEEGRPARPVVCSAADLERTDLSRHRVVLLANVPDLSAGMVAQLEKFVGEGGALLVFLGDRVRPEAYNSRLWTPRGGLLPAKLGVRLGRADHRRAIRLTRIHPNHPLMARFRDTALGDLQRVAVYEAVDLDTATLAQGATVLAWYDNGSPAVVEMTSGRGRVLLWTTSVDADWTNLPVQPVFVPLVHEMVHYLSAETFASEHHRVGEPIRVHLDLAAAGARVEVRDPSGKTSVVPLTVAADRLVAEFTRTQQPGLYRITIAGAGPPRTEVVAVNPDFEESDLQPLEPKALEGCFHPDQRWRLATVDHLAVALADGGGGHKVWVWLLYAALGFFIAEALYAGRLAAELESGGGKATEA